MLGILIFAAALVQAEPAAGAEADVITTPDWLKKPSAEDLGRSWPAAARGRSGKARIMCRVDERGLLYRCEVVSESPQGLGFGPAALLLSKSFQMRPMMRNGKPVSGASVTIPITFEMTGSGAFPTGPARYVLTDPAWRAAPTSAEVAQAYPKGATTPGHVVFTCALTPDDGLKDCQDITGEHGFPSAARKLLRSFRLYLPTTGGRDRASLRVNLPIHMQGPDPAQVRPEHVLAPQWRKALNPEQLQALFPAQAAAAGLKTGRGVAECTVAAGGELEDCRPKSETPEGLGFGEAAARVVDALAIFPWTPDGRPVDGARITVPVKFNLAEPQPPANPPAPRP